MEQFDNIWVIITAAIAAIIPVVTLIVQATPTPKDDNIWGKIALILGRLFSVRTHQNSQGKSGVSVPVLGGTKAKE